ncbi:MAG: hypothetical protein AAF564_19115 [Bacteroidota bacterium]
MKKSAFITLSACALASFAVIKMKQGLRSINNTQLVLTPKFAAEATSAGMFV